MSSFSRCEDGHRCENGAFCTEDPLQEGSFFCDCSTSPRDVAGLYCEYEADSICSFPQEVSETWFCTNGGTCVVDVTPDSAVTGCDCPPQYEGRHCEFVKGSIPDDWPDGTTPTKPLGARGGGNTESNDELSVGIKVVIILIVLIVIGLFALYVIQKRRVGGEEAMNDMHSPKDKSQALQLEADGEVFKESARAANHNGTPNLADYEFDSPEALALSPKNDPSMEDSSSELENGHGRII